MKTQFNSSELKSDIDFITKNINDKIIKRNYINKNKKRIN